MTSRHLRLVLPLSLSICAAGIAAPAHAQGDPVDSAVAHVGLGAGVNFYNPTSSDGKASSGLTLAYRWHSFHSGWGPTFGLDWHTTDFTQPVGSVDAPLGSVRMRAYLAGIGHTRRLGRLTASANVSAGYSFNHLSVDGGAGPAFASHGVSLLGASVDNSWIAKPEVSVWYDVMKHVGLGVSGAYVVARPEEILTTAAGS